MVVSLAFRYSSLRRHPASARISRMTGAGPGACDGSGQRGTDRRRWCVPVERSCFEEWKESRRGGKVTMAEPEISQEMIRLYDEYTHLTLDRRGFMDKLTRLAGSARRRRAIAPLLAANQCQGGDRRRRRSAASRPRTSPSRRGRHHAAATWSSRPMPTGKLPGRHRHPRESRASTRISRTWRGAWRWRASWRWRPTSCRRSAARRATRTRRAT